MSDNLDAELIEPFSNVKNLSLDKIATIASALLIFVMGRFQLANLFGVKRLLEGVLFLPVLVYFLFRISDFSPRKHLNPLIGFILLELILKFCYHPNVLWISDYFFSLIAVYVLLTVSKANIAAGGKWIVSIACFFSIMALIQFAILLFFPNLIEYTQLVLLDNGVITSMKTGPSVVTSIHPIAFLGLMSQENLSILGLEIGRMRSFTSEPSLLAVFFLFPAALGMFLNNGRWIICSGIIVLFSLLSFSGSVEICIIFSCLYILLSSFFGTRFIFIFFPLIILGVTMFILLTMGLNLFTSFDTKLASSSSSSFLAHGNSIIVRGNGVIFAFSEALRSPFGSPNELHLPVSIFLSSIINAGWAGAVLLIAFFYKLIIRIDKKLRSNRSAKRTKVGVAILFGIICTIFLFNDYAMLNYSGLILLIFAYRLVQTPVSTASLTEVLPNDES